MLSDGPFKGTATELLRQIREKLPDHEKYQRGMPRLPNSLSGRLRRLAPALSEMGIEVVLDAGRDDQNRKTIEIRWLEEPNF